MTVNYSNWSCDLVACVKGQTQPLSTGEQIEENTILTLSTRQNQTKPISAYYAPLAKIVHTLGLQAQQANDLSTCTHDSCSDRQKCQILQAWANCKPQSQETYGTPSLICNIMQILSLDSSHHKGAANRMYGYGWGFWVQEIWFEAALLLGSHGFQALLISHKKGAYWSFGKRDRSTLLSVKK